MYGAGAALAVVATLLRAGQVQVLAQAVEQGRARIDIEFVVAAVHAQADVHRGTACGGIGRSRRFAGVSEGNRVKLTRADSNARRAHAREERAARDTFDRCIRIVFVEVGGGDVLGHSSGSPMNMKVLNVKT